MEPKEPLLSAVVIARNERAHLEKALVSALAAVRPYGGEVIYVDSASTDGSFELAASLPVRLLRLKPHWPLSPSAGRHVGLAHVRSRFVFFLDGDTELDPDFLPAALKTLLARPWLAAAIGQRREVDGENGGKVVSRDHYGIVFPRLYRPGDKIGGSGLYRVSAVRQAGGYNPFICSYEETELCLRLHRAGQRIIYLPVPMVTHRDHRDAGLKELKRRLGQRLLFGQGQVLRLHPFEPAIYRDLDRIVCLFLYYLFLFAGAGIVLLLGRPRWLLLLPAAVLAPGLAHALKTREIKRPVYYFTAWNFGVYGLLQGLIMRPRTADEYPDPSLAGDFSELR